MVESSTESMDFAHKTYNTTVVKFLCSYGGKILPRHPDGTLRYVGGETRVLSVDRSIPFTDLLLKLGELCGSSSVTLRCQLPKEDLDALISITSDEDLSNIIEEYDRASVAASRELKIRAFLSLPKSNKKVSPPASVKRISPPASITSSTVGFKTTPTLHRMVVNRCVRQMLTPVGYPVSCEKSAGNQRPLYYAQRGNPTHYYLIHNGNHWQ